MSLDGRIRRGAEARSVVAPEASVSTQRTDVIPASQLPTIQSIQDTQTTSFAWKLRNPFRHKRVSADEDHDAIAGNIEKRQRANELVVADVLEDLEEDREDALFRVAKEIKRLTQQLKRNARKIADKIHEDQNILDEFKHIILEGRALGSALSAVAIIPHPSSGFGKNSFAKKFQQSKDGGVLVTVPAITGEDMLQLPETLIAAINDKIGPDFRVSFEDRSANDDDAAFFKEHIDEDDTEVQRLAFAVVLDCSSAGHQHEEESGTKDLV